MEEGLRGVATWVPLPPRVDAFLFALPALTALARSGRTLAVEVPPALDPLAELQGWAVATAPAAGAGEAVLLAGGPPGLAAAWRAGAAGIPRRWGYGGPVSSLLLTHPVPRPPRASRRGRHGAQNARELLAAMEVPPPPSWTPRLEPTEALREAGLERLRRAHLDPDEETLVGLIPAGFLGEGRRPARPPGRKHVWPWPRYVELARRLRRERPRVRLVLLAGREDLWPAVRIHEETARHHPLVGPDLELPGLVGVLPHLSFVLGADSDLLQLAAAAGRPTVALFGPTSPHRRAPRGDDHRRLVAAGRDLRRLPVEPVLEACLQAAAGR